MANLASIARPYALAAFEYARDKQQLSEWRAFLEAAALIAKNKDVMRLLANPEVFPAKLLALFNDVLKSSLDQQQQNFLSLLAQQKRLVALPEISELFNVYYSAFEKIRKVRVVTATEIDETFRQKLVQSLTKRIHHEVALDCDVDPAILGGAIIHIGDRVIDGSIKGKLARLLQDLTG